MKKIFTLLAFFMAFAIHAQHVDVREPARKDVAELTAIMELNANQKKMAETAFRYKHKALLEENLSEDKKKRIIARTEEILVEGIGEAGLAKLKANPKLYEKLMK